MSDSVPSHRQKPTRLPVPGILQARTLEWVAISFSDAWKWKVKVKSLSRVRPLATPWTTAYQAPPSMGFSRQEYWSGIVGQNHLTETLFYIKCWIYHTIYRIRYWKWKTHWLYVQQDGCNGTVGYPSDGVADWELTALQEIVILHITCSGKKDQNSKYGLYWVCITFALSPL